MQSPYPGSAMLIAPLATIAVLAQVSADAETKRSCAPGPMPAAIESAADPPVASDVIEFTATPSFQTFGIAWVIRVYRRGSVDAGIEIVRRHRQTGCSRYDIGARWRALQQQSEYRAIAGGSASRRADGIQLHPASCRAAVPGACHRGHGT